MVTAMSSQPDPTYTAGLAHFIRDVKAFDEICHQDANRVRIGFEVMTRKMMIGYVGKTPRYLNTGELYKIRNDPEFAKLVYDELIGAADRSRQILDKPNKKRRTKDQIAEDEIRKLMPFLKQFAKRWSEIEKREAADGQV